jgi:hypothetical protein
MPRKSLALLLIALVSSPLAWAQSARWDPPGGNLPVGEVSSLQLVFEDCTPDDAPQPPKVDGLRMDFQGQSSNISIINGTYSKNVSMTFAVLLSKAEDISLPEFTVKTNKGPVRVPAARFSPAGATVGSTGVSLGDAASARLSTIPESVWAGEVFDLKYVIDVAEGYYPSWGRGNFEWDPSPLVTEDWSQPEPFTTRSAPARTGLAYHTRAIAPAPGHVLLNPTSQLINLSVGVTGFGFFQQRQYQQFAVQDTPASIDVRPLPPAPAGFSGAVGDFKVSSKVVPLEVKVGEPVTWTIELTGSGNWPEIRGLPSREAPRAFQVIQPKPKRTQPQGKLFEGTLAEDVVLVPTQAGTFELPALDITYFDPKSGTYKTISAPGATVTADPAGAPASLSEQTPAAPGAPKVSLGAPTPEAKAPELPSFALGEPLPAYPSAPEPLRMRTLAAAAAAPFFLLGLLWSALALRRAAATDPLLPQRQARARLKATLDALREAPAVDKAALLLAWQKDSAVLWRVEHAAPPAAAIGDPAWALLWSEADRFLYSAEKVLAADWTARAEEAYRKKVLRPFSPARLLLPGNLFPFTVLAVALASTALRAADPARAYSGGDFAAAEKQWKAEVSADPLNWSARHNLSLALSQQDRWGEAAAQAAAAFVQAPGAPATARQLVTAGDKAGFIPEPLDAILRQGPAESLARMASPGAWQRIGIGASALLAASLALLLLAAYGVTRRAWAVPAASLLALASILAALGSFFGYRAYGITADTRAVVVWSTGVLRSIPTEADVSQKTTPLPAGSTAVADKAFLRWIRVSFPNGQTGWILRSEATYIWKAPPEQ